MELTSLSGRERHAGLLQGFQARLVLFGSAAAAVSAFAFEMLTKTLTMENPMQGHHQEMQNSSQLAPQSNRPATGAYGNGA